MDVYGIVLPAKYGDFPWGFLATIFLIFLELKSCHFQKDECETRMAWQFNDVFRILFPGLQLFGFFFGRYILNSAAVSLTI